MVPIRPRDSGTSIIIPKSLDATLTNRTQFMGYASAITVHTTNMAFQLVTIYYLPKPVISTAIVNSLTAFLAHKTNGTVPIIISGDTNAISTE